MPRFEDVTDWSRDEWSKLPEDQLRAMDWKGLDQMKFRRFNNELTEAQKKIVQDLRGGPKMTATGRRDASPTRFVVADLGDIATIPSDSLFLHGRTALETATLDRVKDQFTPEWWFVYFWMEAKEFIQRASEVDKQLTIDCFNAAFHKPSNFVLDRKVIPKGVFLVKPARPEDAWANGVMNSVDLCNYLEVFLRNGFSAIRVTENGPVGVDTSHELEQLCLDLGLKKHYELVWRAEGRRDLEELRRTGFKTQANDENRALTCNMRATWHPYHVVEKRQTLWYRKNQNDNCLYAALSLATSWQAALCFPKIAQTPKYPDLHGTVLDKPFRDKNPEYIAMVTFQRTSPTDKQEDLQKYMFVTNSKAALIVLDTKVFDTAAAQEMKKGKGQSYPEMAAHEIEGRRVLAMLSFWRVHHGPTDAEGFTAVIDRKYNGAPQSVGLAKFFLDYKAFGEFKNLVERTYKDVIAACPVSQRWTNTGFEPVPGLPRRIERIFLNGKVVYP
jgi:hypothetical protein